MMSPLHLSPLRSEVGVLGAQHCFQGAAGGAVWTLQQSFLSAEFPADGGSQSELLPLQRCCSLRLLPPHLHPTLLQSQVTPPPSHLFIIQFYVLMNKVCVCVCAQVGVVVSGVFEFLPGEEDLPVCDELRPSWTQTHGQYVHLTRILT